MTHGLCDFDGPPKWDPVVLSGADESLDVAPAHQLGHHVGVAPVVTQVEDGHDVGMGAQASHGLGLPHYPRPRNAAEALRLDLREGHVAVQHRVVDEVHPLLAALA